jgi:hypothetical protein
MDSELVPQEHALGFLFTVLCEMSRPTVMKDASLSMLFDIKESVPQVQELT